MSWHLVTAALAVNSSAFQLNYRRVTFVNHAALWWDGGALAFFARANNHVACVNADPLEQKMLRWYKCNQFFSIPKKCLQPLWCVSVKKQTDQQIM